MKDKPFKGLSDKKVKGEYNKSKVPAYVSRIPTQQALFETQVVVRPQWNPLAVQEMMAAMTGYFLSRSIAAGKDGATKLQALYDGILFQFFGFANETSGLPTLEYRLQIVHDLISAFSQKDITKYTFSKVSYGWTDVVVPTSGAYSTGWNTWNFVENGVDNNSYDAPAAIYLANPTPAQYSTYLALIKSISANRAHFLKVVTAEESSVLKRDASAFSKVYPYLGLNPSQSGGFYNDVENEVDIRAPVLAHNVVYPKVLEDDRVPMKLTVNEGGPATNLAPLIDGFDSWFNKCHINYKYLDIFEVVNTMIYWYIAAVKQALIAHDGTVPAEYTLPFTLQDFVIIVRQHLLATFKDQWMGQFTGPLAYDTNATNFLPFQVLGNCYGNETFRTLFGPILLAENLSMLQTVKQYQTSRKSALNNVVYVPVWGYYNDVQPVWMIPDAHTPVELFMPPTQKSMNLVDCTINGNQFVNVNGTHYSMVRDIWNTKVSELKTFINVIDLGNLSPPSNSAFLESTRVYGIIAEPTLKSLRDGIIKQLPFPALKPIQNLQCKQLHSLPKDVDTKKRTSLPMLPPPTNVANITIDEMYISYPPSKEIYELMHYLILPTIRLDPTSTNDLLNKTMYQTITGEGLSQVQSALSNAPGYLSRQLDTANMCVEGQGKITSSGLSIIMQKLMADGSGGFLAGLLGGLAKSIVPSASGVIDSVASAFPF